jgi:ubiquinone/menaquinone biosynthesis C-methylase UbiE
MSSKDQSFYLNCLSGILQTDRITISDSVLVVCGGTEDKDALAAAGFTKVTISNLDERLKGDEFAPYEWSFQDAENLDFPDSSFDFVIVHNGLHHCYSPHKALVGMLRVARKGVFAVEPRDGFIQRFFVRIGFGQNYEIDSVVKNDLKFGGVANTQIPNFIYRWSEYDVSKTSRCAMPGGEPFIQYFYAMRFNRRRYREMRNPLFRIIASTVGPGLSILQKLFPRIGNRFGFFVAKPERDSELHPWICRNGSEIDIRKDWVRKRYNV